MSALNSTLPYFGGMPTEPDVKRLVEKFGVPELETVIGYDEIGQTIGAHYPGNRWHSVVESWRKLLISKHKIELRPNRLKGFEVCDNRDLVDLNVAKVRRILRTSRNVQHRTMRIDVTKLSDEDKRAHTHIANFVGTLQLSAATSAKQLKLPE